MFILTEFKDVVKIPPWKFKRKLNDAIADELNRKLANKVFLNVGLCIALYDITKLEESYIFPGDGSSHTKVTFRYIVFRPYIEEVLIGKIRSSSPDGVHVSLGFFDDIIIPPNKLQNPSKFNQERQEWVWEYDAPNPPAEDDEMDTGAAETFTTHSLSMEIGDPVRIRIVSESFVETLPAGPADIGGEPVENADKASISPYTLQAAMDEPGLGLVEWWTQ